MSVLSNKVNPYNDGKVYKMTCGELVYVGSTCLSLKKRFVQHVSSYVNSNSNCKTTASRLFEYGEKHDELTVIELLQYVPCTCRKQLETVERKYIESLECVNKYIPTRNSREYYVANADKINKRQKEYDIANADKKKEYYVANADKINKRKGRVVTCECGSQSTHQHLQRHMKTKSHLDKMKLL